jgi:hypothetical protein
MDRKSAYLRRLARIGAAAIAIAIATGGLTGCVSYYERHYGSPGVYGGGTVAASGVYYGSDYGYSQPSYRPVNPVHYPYWSLDYFYFSHFHHPYSFYVGYSQPLYYPYPGWALGHYAHYPRVRYYGGLGYGYPWHGYGHYYPRYSLGFFAYRDTRHHRIRHIDRRLRELQQPAPPVSRRALLGHGRSDTSRAGIPIPSRIERARARSDRLDGRVQSSRGWIRSDALRSDNRGRVDAARSPASRSELLRGRTPQRSSTAPREASERRGWTRPIRRQPDVRSPGRTVRSAPPTRRAAAPDRSRSALLQQRESNSPPPQRARSAPPPRSRPDPPARARSAPRPSSRAAAPQRTRSAPSRSVNPRSSNDAPRSRRDLLRDRGGSRRRP